jgi:hypothetical protein
MTGVMFWFVNSTKGCLNMYTQLESVRAKRKTWWKMELRSSDSVTHCIRLSLTELLPGLKRGLVAQPLRFSRGLGDADSKLKMAVVARPRNGYFFLWSDKVSLCCPDWSWTQAALLLSLLREVAETTVTHYCSRVAMVVFRKKKKRTLYYDWKTLVTCQTSSSTILNSTHRLLFASLGPYAC